MSDRSKVDQEREDGEAPSTLCLRLPHELTEVEVTIHSMTIANNSDGLAQRLLIAQFCATWTMVGIIWFVQVVHYPMFRLVGSGTFEAYHASHVRLITWVVGPPMMVEALCAFLLILYRPAYVSVMAALSGALLLLIIWGSTALVQVPLHELLSRGFQQEPYRRLVLTNWVRTVSWTLRGILTAWMVCSGLTFR